MTPAIVRLTRSWTYGPVEVRVTYNGREAWTFYHPADDRTIAPMTALRRRVRNLCARLAERG